MSKADLWDQLNLTVSSIQVFFNQPDDDFVAPPENPEAVQYIAFTNFSLLYFNF